MTGRMKLSLLLTVSVLLTLVSFPSPALGQQPKRFRADTGIIIPGPHRILRITVTGIGNTILTVRFRQMEYMQDPCNSTEVCKLTVSSQTTSAPITLAPGEAASLDLLATTFGRGIVLSNSPDARVTVHIIDTATGQVDSVLVGLLLP
jgi:hypothetical protein